MEPKGGERVEGREGRREGGGEDRKTDIIQYNLNYYLYVSKTCQHVLPLPTSFLNTIQDRSRKDREK